jgi:hypothetical protein
MGWRLALAGLALLSAQVLAQPAPGLVRSLDLRIYEHVREGRCQEAVQLLNQELKSPDAAALLFSGAMYEHGVCVRRNWDRAIGLYVKAAELHSRAARMRLAAGYRDAANGIDIASTLWWAHAGKVPLPAECEVSGYGPSTTPETFVQTLQRWDAARVNACAYVAAVVAGSLSDPYYPDVDGQARAEGVIELRYEPGEGRFQARLLAPENRRLVEERRWRVGDPIVGERSLLGFARDSALKSVARYRDVPPVDPKWTVVFEWHFTLFD